MLKHDITLLGYLDNGLAFYLFSYDGSEKAYVGVITQEVQEVMPEAVMRARDGYLIVLYDKLGLRLQTYDRRIASGAQAARHAAAKWHLYGEITDPRPNLTRLSKYSEKE
jgi:hypothetical protein